MDKLICKEGVTVERKDDIPLLLKMQERIELSELIDSVIPRHWLHKGLSPGELIVIWNSYILSQGDHRKVKVREWVENHFAVIENSLNVKLSETDFTGDRLGQVLNYLKEKSGYRNTVYLKKIIKKKPYKFYRYQEALIIATL